MDCLSMSSRCSNRQIFDSNPNGSNLDRIAIGSMHPDILGDWMSAVPVVSSRSDPESHLPLSVVVLLTVMSVPELLGLAPLLVE